MKKIVSEDAVRRAFKAIDETDGAAWLRGHLAFCVEPLLAEPWILDADTTIKPLYGHQARGGSRLQSQETRPRNPPKKPGRPSHCYDTYSMASTRLVLDVDVSPGDEHTSKHSAPGLWAFLDRLPRDLWPALLRGDCGFGNEGVMREAEARRLPYLFKLRLTKNVRRMIEKLSGREWVNAGQGFWAKESTVRLEGWSRARRAIVLRRRVTGAVGLSHDDESGAPQLSFAEIGEATEVYEYSVLVTSLDETTDAFGQLYRDRGDDQNIFDDQWGWGGFTTHDLARCRLAARLLALVYNWWNIFVEFARQGRARRKGACSRRRIPARLGQKCGAVDAPANMAGDPVARLPGVPQRTPPARPAPPRAKLMQPQREKPQNPKAVTAVFRMNQMLAAGRL